MHWRPPGPTKGKREGRWNLSSVGTPYTHETNKNVSFCGWSGLHVPVFRKIIVGGGKREELD